MGSIIFATLLHCFITENHFAELLLVYNFGRLKFFTYLCMEMEPMAAIYPIFMVKWPRGEVGVCKTLDGGSSPPLTS